MPLKKRRLVNGKELVFRRPGEGSDDDDEDVGPNPQDAYDAMPDVPPVAIADARKITIIEED